MPTPPLAHAGHDLVTLAMFAPAIGYLVWLAISQARGRRAARGEGGQPPER